MILRRIADELKRRDWGAAVIEIGIVVVGIFIGLQVDDWNNARKERAAERDYLERLHDDIERLIPLQRERMAPRIERLEDLGDLADKLITGRSAEASATDWTDADCDALVNSHIFSPIPTALPVLNEMLSTGAVALVRDTPLRIALSELQIQVSRSEELLTRLDSSVEILTRTHPDALWEELVVAVDDPRRRHDDRSRCDWNAIRTSRTLHSDFADNYSRYKAYVGSGLRDTHEHFLRVHAMLDEALGLEH